MKEGFYEYPERPLLSFPVKTQITNPRIAYIIPTFIPVGQCEDVPGRSRNLLRRERGRDYEYVRFAENKFELLRFTLACIQHYNAGLSFDLFLVDNGSPDSEGRNFIRTFCEHGNATLIERPNIGFSHGAAQAAWQQLRGQYDYFYFNEQDYMPCRDGWLSMLRDKFFEADDIGGVGMVIEGYRSHGYFEAYPWAVNGITGDFWKNPKFRHCNLAGLDLFTSAEILEQIEANGGLMVNNMSPEDANSGRGYKVSPVINEMFWLHNLMDLGYRVVSFDDGTWAFTHGKGYVDFGELEHLPIPERLAPLCHGQMLYFSERMREYFSWYQNMDSFPLIRLPEL